MGCAVRGCQESDGLKTDPCTVCGKHIHHMSAIGVFEGTESALNERFCCTSCVQVVHPSYRQTVPAVSSSETRPVVSSAFSKAPSSNIWAGSDSDFVPSPHLPAGKDGSIAERAVKRLKTAAGLKPRNISAKHKPRASGSSTHRQKPMESELELKPPAVGPVSMAPSSPPPSPVSSLGVPVSVKHSRKAGTIDDVWDLIHTLEKPYRKRNPWKPSVQMYRNVCVLCCLTIKARAKTNRYSWEEALRNTRNATNAKDHIKAKHADHPLAVLAEQKTTQRSKDDVVDAETEVDAVLASTVNDGGASSSNGSPAATTSEVSVTASSPKPFFRAKEKTLNVLISKWLVNQGLPYTVCASTSFQEVMRAATGNATFPLMSRDRHDRLLNGQFQLFSELVGLLLDAEYEQACQLKYLNLMHDIWTSSGKDSIVGASVAFIDSSWTFRYIAMLATVKNDGHNAPLVAKVIESGFKGKYGIDIGGMTRFTMSDTTPSAKNVADHIDTEQEDCCMHLLNLCIGYGLGLKDNIQTVSVWNDSSHSWDKVVTTVTPGGSFDEGGLVIRKLRNLNNYFKTPKQRDALRKIQEALSLPDLDHLTDMDVRVAYTCKLIRRSVVNYAAFDAYFQSTKDSASVWSALTASDWMLAVEMEAVSHFIADLALVEVQSADLVSSYMVVFRRLAENKLKSFKFDAMAVEAPQSRDGNEASHRRVVRTLDQFSEAGKTCLKRTLLQLQARFPKVTKEAMACVLLDPRTKSSAKKISAAGNTSRAEEKAVYKRGLDYLRDEHRKMFAQMIQFGKIPLSQQASSQSSLLSQDLASPFSSPASTGWDDEDDLLLGAPIRASKTREEMKESEINARADAIMKEWLELEPEWLEVAQRQHPDKTKEDLSNGLSIDGRNGMCWSLLGLYKHVDVLAWFRDEGEGQFPSIALLARIHLGKISSSAFQERVFSTGGIVMGPLRTRTDSRRAEKQLLLRHNRDEIVRMKRDAKMKHDGRKVVDA